MYKQMQGGMEELRESWNLPFPVLDHNYSINCKHVSASASHFTWGNFRQTILSIFFDYWTQDKHLDSGFHSLLTTGRGNQKL